MERTGKVTIVDGKDYIDQVKKLISEYTEKLNRDLSFQNLEEELKNPEKKYTAPAGELLVAVEDGTVVGMVAYHKHSDDRCEMKRLYVRPGYRKNKLGNKLVEQIIEHAEKAGFKEMVLDTITPLQAAIHLYKKMGFAECEPYYDNPMNDVVYMKKNLTGILKRWELSDAADLAAVISNKKIQDNLRDGLPYPYTEQDAENFISDMLSANEEDTFAFAITADGKVIGSVGVFRQGNIHRQTAEMGYYIAEEYWGRGIMPRAIKEVCDHVFNNSDIIRIYVEPFAYNTASCRALEKAGFQYEGTLRSNAVKNGKVTDMKMYSRLKTDE